MARMLEGLVNMLHRRGQSFVRPISRTPVKTSTDQGLEIITSVAPPVARKAWLHCHHGVLVADAHRVPVQAEAERRQLALTQCERGRVFRGTGQLWAVFGNAEGMCHMRKVVTWKCD